MKIRKTLKGAASLYIVAFVTLLLGIISLSFVRVMVSNSARNNNTDLSQSALDSAQAGVEDARVAILRYHECLSNSSKSGCTNIIKAFRDGTQGKNGADPCDTVSNILGRNTTDSGNGAVVIQETQNSSDPGNSSSMLQAYTCVKISEELPDYRTTLDNDSRSRIIPIRVDEDKLKDVKKIDVAWFSDVNAHGTITYGNSDGKISANSPTVPLLSVQFFQADTSFKLSELNVQSTSTSGLTDHFNIFLNPINDNTTAVTLGRDITANSLASSAGKGPDGQRYYNVECNDVAWTNSADEFACRARLNLPYTFNNSTNRNESATFLYVSMPTGASATDLSITLRDADDNVIPFVGVQALVDSTGRANDLYRRIETRLELVDIYYPYPEYELEQSGSGSCSETSDDARAGCIRKKTVVAEKCWYTIVLRDGTAKVQECPIVNN